MEYYGEAEQDKFVLNILSNKNYGYFIEIGSNHPSYTNNTFILETKFNWKGIMIEYDKRWLQSYKQNRPNSVHLIHDATTVNYKDLFLKNDIPNNIDYLQIDLEVINSSTINTLKKIENEVMDKYKFSVITFEHDIYRGNAHNTIKLSREIFLKNGYKLVFENISNSRMSNRNDHNPYEDWYVHPALVDMEYVNKLIDINNKNYILNDKYNKTIGWWDIQYP